MRLVLNHSEACEMVDVEGNFTFALAESLFQIYEEAQAYVGFDRFLIDELTDCTWIFENGWVKYGEDL